MLFVQLESRKPKDRQFYDRSGKELSRNRVSANTLLAFGAAGEEISRPSDHKPLVERRAQRHAARA
jgi:hypothetical protein